MAETTDRPGIACLTADEWARALANVDPALPFAAAHWTRWGGASVPGRRSTPIVMHGADGELLVPLFRSGVDGQLGGFGYGMVCPAPGRRGTVPPFHVLASAVCAATGLRGLRTLLPPLGAVPALDRVLGHWTGVAGRPTYLLDLAGGVEAVLARVRGSVRTAVRRAERWGVRSGDAGPGDADALLNLYRITLGRNGSPVVGAGPDLGFLVAGRADTVTVTARGTDGAVLAVCAFAVAANTAFHVLQATSPRGRDTNAGHHAFHATLDRLAARGVGVVDLGSATSAGQERFKRNWGAVAHPTRLLTWSGGAP